MESSTTTPPTTRAQRQDFVGGEGRLPSSSRLEVAEKRHNNGLSAITAAGEERHLPFTRWPRSDEVKLLLIPHSGWLQSSRLGCGGRAKLSTVVDLPRAGNWVADRGRRRPAIILVLGERVRPDARGLFSKATVTACNSGSTAKRCRFFVVRVPDAAALAGFLAAPQATRA